MVLMGVLIPQTTSIHYIRLPVCGAHQQITTELIKKTLILSSHSTALWQSVQLRFWKWTTTAVGKNNEWQIKNSSRQKKTVKEYQMMMVIVVCCWYCAVASWNAVVRIFSITTSDRMSALMPSLCPLLLWSSWEEGEELRYCPWAATVELVVEEESNRNKIEGGQEDEDGV